MTAKTYFLFPSFSAMLAAKVMLPLTLWLTSQLGAWQRWSRQSAFCATECLSTFSCQSWLNSQHLFIIFIMSTVNSHHAFYGINRSTNDNQETGRRAANLKAAFLASRQFVPNMIFQVPIQGLAIPRAAYKCCKYLCYRCALFVYLFLLLEVFACCLWRLKEQDAPRAPFPGIRCSETWPRNLAIGSMGFEGKEHSRWHRFGMWGGAKRKMRSMVACAKC